VSVLILGARSDIGRAIARRYAEAGRDVVLAARRADALDADRADLQTRYRVSAEAIEFDVTAADPDGFFARLPAVPRTVVLVAGALGQQELSETDDAAADLIMRTNYTGPARYLLAAARVMAPHGGCIVGISSVAGDRGRRSNFIYGSAKAGLTAFLGGLRQRFHRTLHVVTIKPGYVDTQMTAGMKLPPLLTAKPAEVAEAVFAAETRGRDVVYVRRVWWPIMTIIRGIPEPVFKRLKL